jgi:hypothetical protein
MSDDLIRDRELIRNSDEADDRDARYWAAITRDQSRQTVDAVTRLADSEQEALQARLDQAEARVDQLTDTIDRVRSVAADGWWSDNHRCDVIKQADLIAALTGDAS